ncbi:MAG: amidohydrolase family protein [Thermoplasmatota archaeon]
MLDAHVHVQPWSMLRPAARRAYEEGRSDVAELLAFQEDPAKLRAFLTTEGIDAAVIVNYVSPDVMGFSPKVNEWVANYCKPPDGGPSGAPPGASGVRPLIPMGSLHPALVEDAIDEMDYLVQKLGIRALKVHPGHQLFPPNAYADDGGFASDDPEFGRKLADIYEECESHEVPITFHTGTSVFPGAKNRYADPMLLDEVAVDFPDLTLLVAHAGRPLWYDTAFFLARRHDNVYLELSGIPPKKLLDVLPRLAEMPDKLVWGSDWPGPGVKSMRANVEAFLDLPLPDDVKRKTLWTNGAKVFGLS